MNPLLVIVIAIAAFFILVRVIPYTFGRLCGDSGIVGDIANIILWAIRHIWVVIVIGVILYLTK